MESRDAIVLTFTIHEAALAMVEAAKKLGRDIPNVIENIKVEMEPNRSLVHCIIISPMTIKTGGVMGNA